MGPEAYIVADKNLMARTLLPDAWNEDAFSTGWLQPSLSEVATFSVVIAADHSTLGATVTDNSVLRPSVWILAKIMPFGKGVSGIQMCD